MSLRVGNLLKNKFSTTDQHGAVAGRNQKLDHKGHEAHEGNFCVRHGKKCFHFVIFVVKKFAKKNTMMQVHEKSSI